MDKRKKNKYLWDEVKNHEIGDFVTSKNSILITKGFTKQKGEIIGYAPDGVDCMQYVILLEDKRLLYLTDWLIKEGSELNG